MPDRRLYANDCLSVLHDEVALPSGSVDLIYLDPPFNSNATYNLPFKNLGNEVQAVAAFKDTWTWSTEEDELLASLSQGVQTSNLAAVVDVARSINPTKSGNDLGAYLVNMAVRLIPMKRVLKQTGSIYLHCDPTASHYLKLLMDGVFGAENFRNEIIWRIGWVSGFKTQKRGWIRNHDTILYYVASEAAIPRFNKEYLPYPPDYRRRDGKKPTGRGFPIEDTWNSSVGDVLDSIMIKSFSREKLGYPTQKPVQLMNRIVQASSNPGEMVLDPFCGCGTTVHAAEAGGRNWIGIDISTFSSGLVQDRLRKAFPNLAPDDIAVYGVPRTVAEARALAARDKFEFEKWVCGEIGAQGLFHEPGQRGPDQGVDGVIEFYPIFLKRKPQVHRAIVQAKGGNVTPDAVGHLYSRVKKFGATAGVLICFADQLTTVENHRNRDVFSDDVGTYPVIQALTVEDLLDKRRVNLPTYRRSDDENLQALAHRVT